MNNFSSTTAQGSAHSAILHRSLCCRFKCFNEFIQQHFQALGFCFFWAKPKENSHLAASRNKPIMGKRTKINKTTPTPPKLGGEFPLKV
ncbi:hypothetical protein [Pedobacter sp.]|uniref:hypothetical protein n=1 Tax=Pedobacter sp. TaxID=1411316 RepID=UPI003BAA7DD6